jgi:pyruvate kinase
MIEYFQHKKKTLAIILYSSYKVKGIKFLTPSNFSQQLGYMNRPKNYVIFPHKHNSVSRKVKLTNEVLFIKSGKLRVDFYDDDENYLESRILKKGDVILLIRGGHGFYMLKNTEIIEVKQGPYIGDIDKSRFKPIAKDKIKLLKK